MDNQLGLVPMCEVVRPQDSPEAQEAMRGVRRFGWGESRSLEETHREAVGALEQIWVSGWEDGFTTQRVIRRYTTLANRAFKIRSNYLSIY